jgi:hypothetical protein
MRAITIQQDNATRVLNAQPTVITRTLTKETGVGPPGPAGAIENAVIISETPLIDPVDGQGWLDSTTGIVSYWDATQEVWVALPPTGESEPTTEAILEALQGDSTVIVDTNGTDTQRGTALVAAYAAAKLLTPNGKALSATNRASVLLPLGGYELVETLVLDTDFVDLFALVPTRGDNIQIGEFFQPISEGDNTGCSLSTFRPPSTLVYTNETRIDTVRQTCNDVRLAGFGIAQMSIWVLDDLDPLNFQMTGAFTIEATNNYPSIYRQMYFWCRCVGNGIAGGVTTIRNIDGLWIDCIANSNSWTIGKGFWTDLNNDATCDTLDGEFRCRMYDCQGGPQSFIGDALEITGSTGKATGCRLIRCKCVGTLSVGGDNGDNGFSGCGIVGADVDSTCYFEDCKSGPNSFGLGKLVEATYVRCTGAASSFGSGGIFAGIAIDCDGGLASFGGRNTTFDANLSGAKCTGTLTRCKSIGNVRPVSLDGATLRGCRFTTTTTGQGCLWLLDSDSVVEDCTLVVVQGGTGVPINAGSALNVSAYHCRMNNASNDVDGLGSNVTNLVTTSGNVVSDSIT